MIALKEETALVLKCIDKNDSTAPTSPAGQTRDTPRKQSNLSESERIGYSGRRDLSKVRPLSLFDSLVGQWRCSCCGTYAGVVLKCSAVACTVRAHPLCVSIAGPKWTAFEVNLSSSGLNQPGRASQTALGFLCSLHSPKGTDWRRVLMRKKQCLHHRCSFDRSKKLLSWCKATFLTT